MVDPAGSWKAILRRSSHRGRSREDSQRVADYDLFQFVNRIKPDYCNAGGVQRWCTDNGEGKPGWEDWYDEETGDDFDEHRAAIRDAKEMTG